MDILTGIWIGLATLVAIDWALGILASFRKAN